MVTGRPTEYKSEYIQAVDAYLEKCHFDIEEWHKTRGEKSDTYERVARINLPKVEGFAEYLDVSKNTLYDWASQHKQFSDALDKIKVRQHNYLVDGGIQNLLNPTIVKLMLSSNHGYTEKSDVTSAGKALPQPLLYNVLTNDKPQENSDTE
jgi:hypothetical protein